MSPDVRHTAPTPLIWPAAGFPMEVFVRNMNAVALATREASVSIRGFYRATAIAPPLDHEDLGPDVAAPMDWGRS